VYAYVMADGHPPSHPWLRVACYSGDCVLLAESSSVPPVAEPEEEEEEEQEVEDDIPDLTGFVIDTMKQ